MIRIRLTRYARLIVSLLGILLITACQQQGETGMSDNAADSEITELQITDVVNGDGATAQAGQEVIVHYTGCRYDTSQPDTRGRKIRQLARSRRSFLVPARRGPGHQGLGPGHCRYADRRQAHTRHTTGYGVWSKRRRRRYSAECDADVRGGVTRNTVTRDGVRPPGV